MSKLKEESIIKKRIYNRMRKRKIRGKNSGILSVEAEENKKRSEECV